MTIQPVLPLPSLSFYSEPKWVLLQALDGGRAVRRSPKSVQADSFISSSWAFVMQPTDLLVFPV
jgi:hypothetical protein